MTRTRDVAALILLAGLTVGAIRQGHDARAVRSGSHPGVSANTPSSTQGLIAFGVPARPDTKFARAISALWSGPLTAVGFFLAYVGGAQPHFDHVRGCWVAVNVGGLSAALQRRINADAHTMGQMVLCRTPTPTAALLDHESAHVRQGERFGLLMPLIYGLLTARYGYQTNLFEASARNYAWEQK